MKLKQLIIRLVCDCEQLIELDEPDNQNKTRAMEERNYTCRNCGMKFFVHVQQSALHARTHAVKQETSKG